MRRLVLLTAATLVPLVAGACQHDGRGLREPQPGQYLSISTSSSSPQSTAAIDSGDFDTLPGEGLELVAPWRDGATIDAWATCDGLNQSPALSWSPAPEGTVEIAIAVTDLDAPGFVHWVVAGLSPASTVIAEDIVPTGAYQGTNSLGDVGYTGPCPPAGQQHTYLFTVYFLGTASGLDDGADGTRLLSAIQAAAIDSASITGLFGRP